MESTMWMWKRLSMRHDGGSKTERPAPRSQAQAAGAKKGAGAKKAPPPKDGAAEAVAARAADEDGGARPASQLLATLRRSLAQSSATLRRRVSLRPPSPPHSRDNHGDNHNDDALNDDDDFLPRAATLPARLPLHAAPAHAATLRSRRTTKTSVSQHSASKKSASARFSTIQHIRILLVGVVDPVVLDGLWINDQPPLFESFLQQFPHADLVLVAKTDPNFDDYTTNKFSSIVIAEDLTKLPFKDSEFDLVCQQWDPDENEEACLKEVMRVAKAYAQVEIINQISSSMFYLEEDDDKFDESYLRTVPEVINVMTRIIKCDNATNLSDSRRQSYQNVNFQINKNTQSPDVFDY